MHLKKTLGGAVACALLLGGCTSPRPHTSANRDEMEPVNTGQGIGTRIITPVNQVLTPVGIQVELPGIRPQALALSPDGMLLAVAGNSHELILVNPGSGEVLQKVEMPSELATNTEPASVSSHILSPDEKAEMGYTGLVFSKDGSRIYVSNVNGSIKVFTRDGTHGAFKAAFSFPLPKTKTERAEEIPAGMAISPDGKSLYVAGNLSNHLLELDANTGALKRTFQTGNVPYDVVLAGDFAFVSNWGGRLPDADSVTGPAGHGTRVRVDPVTYIANEGSVSVIDLRTGETVTEILAGIHSSGMALSPNGAFIAIANGAGDSVSVIDVRQRKVVETISVLWQAGDPFGASPNALAFSPSGNELYVCNGTQNAVAVVRFKPGRSRIHGLIPTGWFPGAIVFDQNRSKLLVANIKGIGAGKRLKPGEKAKFNSKQSVGSLSIIEIPSRHQLARETEVVLENMRRSRIEDAFLPPRPDQPARPVPERAGEPSVFKHVVYIIKENRTYDQVLGDVKEGDGNPDLCIFGEKFTPNQHKMVRDFVLLDNTYCSGMVSADGHQWADSAFGTDYLEKSVAGWPRSYPDGMEESDIDALAYAPSGFLWDLAIKHGVTVRSYGEFTMGHVHWKDAKKKGKPSFKQIYDDFKNGTGLIEIGSVPAVESLRGHIMANTIGWDLDVPDVFRAAQFIQELRAAEQSGEMPALSIICLPNDHTSGSRSGSPKPGSHVADNDFAFGRILEAISHSRFWTNTCVFAIEDDPQAGWDHVSGYRTTAYVASAYTKRHTVVHNNYNQTSLIRTMELILGLPPMNQMDASASPMSACFNDTPDFAPFDTVPNQVPLDDLNPPARALHDPVLRHDAIVSAGLPLEKVDACPEDVLNRILWRAQRGSQALYPAWALTHVADEDDKD
jgi:DNA-binding beta-propeller fold protein YncE